MRHLLKKAKAFKSRSIHCTACRTGTGRKRRYKHGGSVRGKIVSIGQFLNRHKAKIGTVALGALWLNRQHRMHRNALARMDPLF